MVTQANTGPEIYPRIQYHLAGKRFDELKGGNAFTPVQNRDSFHHDFAELNGLELQDVRAGHVLARCKPPFDKTKNAYDTLCGGATATYADVVSTDCAEALIPDSRKDVHAVTSELAIKFHKPVNRGEELTVEAVADIADGQTRDDGAKVNNNLLKVYGLVKDSCGQKVATSITTMAYVDSKGKTIPKSAILTSLAA
jgi:acyl-coenzyme A thioesterase PaaI-like protein